MMVSLEFLVMMYNSRLEVECLVRLGQSMLLVSKSNTIFSAHDLVDLG